MKSALIILSCLLPQLILGQNKTTKPFEMTPQEVSAKGIRSIKSIILPKRGSTYIIEAAYFDKFGHRTKLKTEEFKDSTFFNGKEISSIYHFAKDTLVQVSNVNYSMNRGGTEQYKYENGKLIFKVGYPDMKIFPWAKRHRLFPMDYEYNADGLLSKIKTENSTIVEYVYKDGRLIKMMIGERMRKSIRVFSYSKLAKLISEVMISFRGDTISQTLYNENGQSVLYSSGHNTRYYYEEVRSYDKEGNLVLKKKERVNVSDEKKPLFSYVTYTYKEGLLAKLDSFKVLNGDSVGTFEYLSYNRSKKCLRSVTIDRSTKDTIYIDYYKYNGQDLLTESYKHYFEKQGFYIKTLFTYEDTNLITKESINYTLKEKCETYYYYDDLRNNVKQVKYCDIESGYHYSDMPTQIIEKYFDEEGNLMCDVTKKQDVDSGYFVSRIDSFFYANGKLTKKIRAGFYSGKRLNYYLADLYTYDKKGNLTWRHQTGSYGTITWHYLYRKRQLNSLEYIRSKGKTVKQRIIIEYDKKENKIRSVWYDGQGKKEHEIVYEYTNGLLSKRINRDLRMDKVYEGVSVYNYDFY